MNGAVTFFIVINMPPLQILVSRLTEPGGVLGLVYMFAPIVSLIALMWSWDEQTLSPRLRTKGRRAVKRKRLFLTYD